MANQLLGVTGKIISREFLRSAAKQSERCLIVPVRLRRAIKKYLREQADPHMTKKVRRLSENFSKIKLLAGATPSEMSFVNSDATGGDRDKRWKVKSSYGDIGFTYSDDETIAYVASRMPAVYSACYRILSEVRRRLPDFSPSRVLDFGAGTGSAFWAIREVWPKSVEKMNVVEPSSSMQRAGRSLIQDLKDLPLIRGYQSILSFSKDIKKREREHDLVIASYVLGEIPSTKDRIAVVRQLWGLTRDLLVLVEPGTPQGFRNISLMRSHILWMERRKQRKLMKKNPAVCKDIVDTNNGAFVVAPCAHDGRCPLQGTGKYCHFVQRLQRTSSQRACKRLNGESLQGFEDEKFSFVVLRKKQRPREPWPLDEAEFEAKDEKTDICYGSSEGSEAEDDEYAESQVEKEMEDVVRYESDVDERESEDVVRYESDVDERESKDVVRYESDVDERETEDGVRYESDVDEMESEDVEVKEEEKGYANVSGGWGRIMFMPVRRGKRVTVDVCRSTNRDASEGCVDRFVVTRGKNPTLHNLSRKCYWGDLWPF